MRDRGSRNRLPQIVIGQFLDGDYAFAGRCALAMRSDNRRADGRISALRSITHEGYPPEAAWPPSVRPPGHRGNPGLRMIASYGSQLADIAWSISQRDRRDD